MSASFRRFEILLPCTHNDGRQVPDEQIASVILELEAQFGAVSSETQVVHGLWRYEGQLYRDQLIRVVVDAPDNSESMTFMTDFKAVLMERFEQLDIWMTTFLVDVL